MNDMLNSIMDDQDDRHRSIVVDVYAVDDGVTGYPVMGDDERPSLELSHRRRIRDIFTVDYRWRHPLRERARSRYTPEDWSVQFGGALQRSL